MTERESPRVNGEGQKYRMGRHRSQGGGIGDDMDFAIWARAAEVSRTRSRLKSRLVRLGAEERLPRYVVFALINLLGLRHA